MTIKKNKKNHAGRPPKYKTALQLQTKIDRYFKSGLHIETVIVGKGEAQKAIEVAYPTITGLVMYCGFSNRHSFYDLEKQDEFSHTIKMARSRLEQHYEMLLQRGLGAGAIFALKNFGWRDTTEINHSGRIDLSDMQDHPILSKYMHIPIPAQPVNRVSNKELVNIDVTPCVAEVKKLT
jgi:hypothetical protein